MDQQQIKIKLNEQPWQQCECGGMLFDEKLSFKRVSGLLTGQSEAQYVPVQMVVCSSCQKVPGFMQDKLPQIPDELKAKQSLI